MPTYPLPESEEVARGGISMVTQAELAYVEQYRHAAATIWNEAWKANSEINKAISGWEAVVAQAKQTQDFTQKAAWEAVIQLDGRFSNAGGSFRAFLATALAKVQRVQWLADGKHRIAAEILGKDQ